MTEDQYWGELYKRFQSLGERIAERLGGHCDWLEARSYRLGAQPSCVMGKAGFLGSGGREIREWSFRLLLDQPYESVDEIPWERQLPTHADWLHVDSDAGLLEIHPIRAR